MQPHPREENRSCDAAFHDVVTILLEKWQLKISQVSVTTTFFIAPRDQWLISKLGFSLSKRSNAFRPVHIFIEVVQTEGVTI